MISIAFLAAVLLPVQVPSIVPATIDRAVYAEVQQAGAASWVAHLDKRKVASFSGMSETENWDKNSQGITEVVGKYRLAVRQSRDSTRDLQWVHVHDPDRTDGLGSRKVTNERYRFELRNVSEVAVGTNASSPRLSMVRLKVPETVVFTPQFYHDTVIEMGYRFLGVPLHDLMKVELFELVDCHHIPGAENQRRRIELRFRCVLKERIGPLIPNANYWVALCPERSWLIESAGIQGGDVKVNHEERIEYCDKDNGDWFPCRSRITRRVEGQPSFDVITTTVSDVGPFQSDDSEFYLPFYGISETAIETPTHGRLFRITAIALGISLVIVAFWLFRRADRRRRAIH